ncbi:MAG: 6-carboxytetrahydropterin synthase QueD [Rhodomicrobium sp.]
MMRIYKEFNFEAGHYLPSAPAGHPNSRIHGHSFHVRVTVEGEPDSETGLLIHFEEFKDRLATIRDQLDHRFLNEIPGLETPTLERIAQWMWHELEPDVPGLADIHVARPSCGEGCIVSRNESITK